MFVDPCSINQIDLYVVITEKTTSTDVLPESPPPVKVRLLMQ